MMATVMLVSCLAVNRVSVLHALPQNLEAEHIEEACPPCELLFSKLETTGRGKKLSQQVNVQQRGEPKSGTVIMYSWARAALIHACNYLKEHFGEGSCRFDTVKESDHDDDPLDRYPGCSIIFEPARGGRDSRCSCDTIDRVSIIVSMKDKHKLPVNDTCAFTHGLGIGIGKTRYEGNAMKPPCTFADGTEVKHREELWRCMHEANCDVTDDWVQMAIFRDPRPAVVSMFYHVELRGQIDLGDLDAFVAKQLPVVCQWLAARYILFTGIMADQSMEIWYNDAMADPVGWHYHWFSNVGLQLPFRVVQATAQAAAANDLGFGHTGFDLHPDEEARTAPGVRRFQDEVGPDLIATADDVLRTWLPPVLLERLGVLP